MDKPIYETMAWRVDFAEPAGSYVTPGFANEDSWPAESAKSLPVESAMDSLETETDSFALIWAPPTAAGAQEIEKRMEASDTTRPPIRASVRTVKVLWTDSRALIACNADQTRDAADAVLRFTQTERRLATVERGMAEIAPRLRKLKDVLHSVSTHALRRQREIDALTERVADYRMTYLEVQAEVEQLNPRLTSGAKRLYGELIAQGAVYERMEALEDPLEFAASYCDVANTRLIEKRNARNEVVLEMLIVAVLVLEIVEMAFLRH